MTPLAPADFRRRVVEADGPVLLDFHAAWCAPCRAQAPILERLATELAGAIAVLSVDVDANPALAGLLQVRALPTVLLFRGGRIVRRFSGLTGTEALRAAVAPP